jgi:hypothetical protein
MKQGNLVLAVFTAVLFSACASHSANTDDTSKTKSSDASKAKTNDTSSGAKASTKSADGEIIGKPAPGSKFAKLKIGMPLNQAVALIGPPTSQWTQPTGKAHIPFYYGPDRWVHKYAYKGEGELTFNGGEERALTRIEVNKAQ